MNTGTVPLDEIRKIEESAECLVHYGSMSGGTKESIVDPLITMLRSLLEERESHGPEGRNYTNAQVVKLREELEQVKKERDSLPTQWAYDQACKALWKHRDDAETLRSELEQVKKERDDWKYQLEFMSNTAWQDALDSVAVKNEIISLRSELAAKDKVLEWYAADDSYVVPHIGCTAKVMADKGERARSILSQYAKETES